MEIVPGELPVDDGGWLRYDPVFLRTEWADRFLRVLRGEVDWQQESGRFGPLPRLTAWCADPGVNYRYSGVTHRGGGWPPPVQDLRRRVERATGTAFNAVLLNLYRDGRDSMGAHSDDEPELGENPPVASISLGAPRRFVLRHRRTGRRLVVEPAHGSLLLMGGTLQHHWTHELPKTRRPVGERINLTFRRIRRSVR